MADKKEKILIVEDDTYISKMYQLKLNLDGYDVEVAENGRIGLDKVKTFKPDIMLLDILMPEMDGFEVLKAIKEDSSIKNIPILIMSNLGQEDHIQKGKELGAIGYIVKTQYTPAKVVETIKEVLSKKTKANK
ncbi:response regulator [bacterium (Candidatus Howlettbacteria) CG_4_10_14_0_8_um_filter_40_9]|nr:MAG: response regulator [bacterium (Candidatus Howlettbacteria) CG_4_10_14_0_8_um_filter_40_9]